MNDEFVDFETALALAELGFSSSLRWNEDVMAGYNVVDRELYMCHLNDDGSFYIPDEDIHAPLKQQVFKFFRKKYNFHPLIRLGRHYKKGTVFDFDIFVGPESRIKFDNYWKSYEEAENACIDKLIELAKKQKQ